jgi:hypothetical protein
VTTLHEGGALDVSPDQLGEPSWFSAPLAWLAVGLIIGAVFGGLVSLAKPQPKSAVTTIEILTDAEALASTTNSGTGTSDDTTSFVQGQLVVLNGNDLRQQVQRKLLLSGLPAISASQIGTTDVVNITASASTVAQARAIATQASSTYRTQRVSQLSTEVKQAISTLDTQVNAVKADIATASKSGSSSSVTALQSEYESLLDQLNTLQVSQAGVSRAVSTLQPAVGEAPGLSSKAKYVLGLAVVGAIIALIALFVDRRIRPRIHTIADLGAIGVRPLLPSVARDAGDLRHRDRESSRSLALLAARLVPGANAVLIGTTSGVGTSYVTAAIATQLAQIRRVLLIVATDGATNSAADLARLGASTNAHAVLEADVASGSAAEIIDRVKVPTRTEGLWVVPCGESSSRRLLATLGSIVTAAQQARYTVLIDGPSLDRSSVSVELARLVDGAILVVGRGISQPVDVMSAVDILESRDIPVAGAVVNTMNKGLLGRILSRLRPGDHSRLTSRRSGRPQRPRPVTPSREPRSGPDQDSATNGSGRRSVALIHASTSAEPLPREHDGPT